MGKRRQIARDAERCVLQRGCALTQSIQEIVEARNLVHCFGPMRPKTRLDLRIIGEMVDLPIHQRKCLVLDGMCVAQPGDE